MTSGTDYVQEYGQAQKAYMQGNYQQAADIINRLVDHFPDDPSALLLRGHIYCYGLQQYDMAREQYEKVLNLTTEADFIDYANKGIEDSSQFHDRSNHNGFSVESEALEVEEEQDFEDTGDLSEMAGVRTFSHWETNDESDAFDLGSLDFEEGNLDDFTQTSAMAFADPFANSEEDSEGSYGGINNDLPFGFDGDSVAESERFPIAFDGDYEEDSQVFKIAFDSNSGEDSQGFQTWQSEDSEFDLAHHNFEDEDSDLSSHLNKIFQDRNEVEDQTAATFVVPDSGFFAHPVDESSLSESLESPSSFDIDAIDTSDLGTDRIGLGEETMGATYHQAYPAFEDETLLMESSEIESVLRSDPDDFDYSESGSNLTSDAFDISEYDREDPSFEQNGYNSHDPNFDFDEYDHAFGHDPFDLDDIAEDESGSLSGIEDHQSSTQGFLEEFDVFDEDLGSIPDFYQGVSEDNSSGNGDEADFDLLSNRVSKSGRGMGTGEPGDSLSFGFSIGEAFSEGGDDGYPYSLSEDSLHLEGKAPRDRKGDSARSSAGSGYGKTSGDDEMFSISGSSEQIPIFNQPKDNDYEIVPSIEQGWLAFFENASLKRKNLMTSVATGVVASAMVAVVSFVSANLAAKDKPGVVIHLRNTSGLMTLIAGIASFGTTLFLGRITTKQIQQATQDLQVQFDAVSQGNLNVNATVYSEGELGQLATSFNQMARVILTTTSEAQRKAEEQEQAKEDLQRQVIRLLDDVEGAARGDLTVQAEVTADVLGAVADSFNLTIQNLREIVQQVKDAARKVTKGSNDSESFARALSSDALRQAEELAVTLNSVQVMTDSIQRVAEAAREAEDVAHSASATALKGGEAVERTVAGILQIRETVAETTRKVKRLAESSQEISKIVAVISSIASRTNLLALNASIEAARAGEAGRGFAIVADEVRQLADRAAKALKEIEQIVLQIQSETSSVMTAMEEGTQQVIDGTKRAEQAKRSLEDIIQVSNRIDALVRSIKADTVEQTDTSRAVAQVMQSVELTAQETSQEAQRVSSALQNLVGVARDLLTSVERFRVEANDGK
ncbi:MAG TPA: chemotaxis protein [Cyanobacteria bacterium UBA11149]|nr:chemotaxis protein [Cyanobacteria bacterium UBA11367]HBE55996.1 chemotaxis protein [Cyanobacteria bacterium UBA11366]HBR77032.1 chemotaxis protein [Cyanobacteria bacterium UBA11159]HBS68382.1 chemotaxis protein [Cyanobacteria bacterium UBA11153]HBW89014.1 chemotaxis protein [Cyanobacteria bacterium UBA11149]HCA94138.1 chemotaxis protein [Cyanobacteria bacterium UBA9226]